MVGIGCLGLKFYIFVIFGFWQKFLSFLGRVKIWSYAKNLVIFKSKNKILSCNYLRFRYIAIFEVRAGIFVFLKTKKITFVGFEPKFEVGQLQKYFQKKLQIICSILEFAAPLCDKNSLRYLNLLSGTFFVPPRYNNDNNNNNNKK